MAQQCTGHAGGNASLGLAGCTHAQKRRRKRILPAGSVGCSTSPASVGVTTRLPRAARAGEIRRRQPSLYELGSKCLRLGTCCTDACAGRSRRRGNTRPHIPIATPRPGRRNRYRSRGWQCGGWRRRRRAGGGNRLRVTKPGTRGRVQGHEALVLLYDGAGVMFNLRTLGLARHAKQQPPGETSAPSRGNPATPHTALPARYEAVPARKPVATASCAGATPSRSSSW